MPSLVAFGRRWNISSDDFVFPGLSEALVRSAWVLITLILFIFHKPLHCTSLEWLVYLCLLIVGNVVTVFLCLSIAKISARGSILDMQLRKRIVNMIYVRVPLFIAEIIFTILSAIFAFGSVTAYETCFSRVTLQFTVVLECFLIICVFFGVVIVFNPLGGYNVDRNVMVERTYWHSRLRLCKVMQTGEMREAIDEIASLLATFFADQDLVLSDIVAGLLLLVHCPDHSPPRYLTIPSNELDVPAWMSLPSSLGFVARICDFVVAVYGWPNYMLNNCTCVAWYGLYRQLRCCRRCDIKEVVVVEDNCCSCHSAAFRIESCLEEADVFFASFRNRLYQVPFVVLADHRTNSIVITIRGSASVLDLVTDLSLSEEVFSVDVDSDPILKEDRELDSTGDVRVHRGMLNSARYVFNTLKKYQVLEDLKDLHPDYGLIVCGHSLGAGVASLLTLLLKQTDPDVRCYSFSPPGCVISEHGLAEMESHVLSVIVGDDLVPRISYQSLMKLKKSIDEQIYSTNRAKYEILIKGIFKLFFSSPWDLHSETTPSIRSSRRLIDSSSYNIPDRGLEEPRTQLYPPGRLLHLVPQGSEVELNWLQHEYLSEVQLTGAILADHMPYRVRRVIQKARDENFYV
uniref:sn-1-specific diacylglycerol lipase n=1 Tax=Bursaphelenchus xylophilus TaxID=6326 RepID=A0A1I7STQ4_BURXY